MSLMERSKTCVNFRMRTVRAMSGVCDLGTSFLNIIRYILDSHPIVLHGIHGSLPCPLLPCCEDPTYASMMALDMLAWFRETSSIPLSLDCIAFFALDQLRSKRSTFLT